MLLIVEGSCDSCRVGSEYLLFYPTTVVDVQDLCSVKYIVVVWVVPCMALKRTSEILTIGARVTESAANTFTQAQIDLQLNPLDQEVLLIYAVDLQVDAPDGVAATNTSVTAALTSTSQTGLSNISQSFTLAAASTAIRAGGPGEFAAFESRSFADTPSTAIPYIGIVATNDMFIQVLGANNAVAKTCNAKIYCARAKADAATFSALVQSEILSS